jgi:hypothetical protein
MSVGPISFKVPVPSHRCNPSSGQLRVKIRPSGSQRCSSRFQDPTAGSQTRFRPRGIGTWSQLLACTEIEYAEMARYVSDDVALMRPQCQIRRLEIAMNWVPRGSSCPDTSNFFGIAVMDKNISGHWGDVHGTFLCEPRHSGVQEACEGCN